MQETYCSLPGSIPITQTLPDRLITIFFTWNFSMHRTVPSSFLNSNPHRVDPASMRLSNWDWDAASFFLPWLEMNSTSSPFRLTNETKPRNDINNTNMTKIAISMAEPFCLLAQTGGTGGLPQRQSLSTPSEILDP
jgi:hypothetical protein